MHAVFSAPKATDAQGLQVPTYLRADTTKNVLHLHIDHRNAGAAYPILADPVYLYWYVVRGVTYNVLGNGNQRAAQGYSALFPAVTMANNIYAAYGQTWPTADAVVGLQEICTESLPTLQGQLSSRGLSTFSLHAQTVLVPLATGGYCHYGIATLWSSQYPYSASPSCVVRLPRDSGPQCDPNYLPGSGEPRRVQRIGISFPNAYLRTFNTHLMQPPIPPLQPVGGYQYWVNMPAEAVRDIVSSDSALNKMVMGDFNVGYGGQPCGPGGSDVYYNANSLYSFYPSGGLGLDDANSSHLHTFRCKPPPGTTTYTSQLDYIFDTQARVVNSAAGVFSFPAESDHDPFAVSMAVLLGN